MPLFDIFKSLIPTKPPTCSVVIAAAGNSSRCKGEDKLLYEISGKPVLAHTTCVFERCEFIDEIIIVTRAEQLTEIARLCKEHGFNKVSKIIAGGETRTASVMSGIMAVHPRAKYIAVHDGARPCIDIGTIHATLLKAAKYHAAAPGIPVASTMKRAGSFGPGSKDKIILETVDRDGLYEIQTPQIFKAEIIKAALTNAIDKDIPLTDDCMAVELLGVPVHIIEGSRRNIKITEIDDLQVAERFLDSSE